MDGVCSGCSAIVVYGGRNIVFGTKRSNQRTHWMQYAVRSRIVVYGGGHCLWCKRSIQRMQWMQYAVE